MIPTIYSKKRSKRIQSSLAASALDLEKVDNPKGCE